MRLWFPWIGEYHFCPSPTIVMFGSIAVAGINILASVEMDRRALIIVAVSLALGLGVVYVPEILDDKPALIKNVFSSGISIGGLTAILLNLLLPQDISSKEQQPAETEL